jgi:hypothetical protein
LHELLITHMAQGNFYEIAIEITYNVQLIKRVGQFFYILSKFMLYQCQFLVNHHNNRQSNKIYSQYRSTCELKI